MEPQVDDVLFEGLGLLFELVDVVGRAEPGLAPGVLTEQLGQAGLELVGSVAIRAQRCWAASRSACREARLTAGPPPGAVGGWAAAAWICSSSSRWR